MTRKHGLRISAWRERVRDDARGASAVEFAIIAPLFFMMTFGAITGAMAFQQRSELTAASREGARYGATVDLDTTFTGCSGSVGACWAEHVRNVTIDRAFGNLDTGVSGRGACVAVVEGNPPSVVGDYVIDGGAGFTAVRPGGQDECYSDTGSLPAGQDPGTRVQVSVIRDGQLNAVLFRMALTLSSDASVQLEES